MCSKKNVSAETASVALPPPLGKRCWTTTKRYERDRRDDRYGDRGRDRYGDRDRGGRYGRSDYRRERRRSPPRERRLPANFRTKAVHQRDPAKRDCRVYIWNLPWSTTWKELKDHFRSCAEVAYADVMMDYSNGRSKGCGVVEFTCKEDAQKAIDTMYDSVLDGRKIALREDRPEGEEGYTRRGPREERREERSEKPPTQVTNTDNPELEKKMDDDLDDYFRSRPEETEAPPSEAQPAEAAPAE